MIIWILGQPGAGKTTLANAILQDTDLKLLGMWAQIDGDNIRDIFQNKDYSKAGRIKNGDFAIQLCKYLDEQGLNVVVSVVTPYQETREKVRSLFPEVDIIELSYDHSEGRRDEKFMVSDYESTPINFYVIEINTSNKTVEDSLILIKSMK